MVVTVGCGISCSRVGYQGVGGWTAAWAFLQLQSERALPPRAQASSPASYTGGLSLLSWVLA